METRKLILYIACSADGFIAKPGDDLSFLDRVQKEGEDYGYKEFMSKVDTVILGRRTYDWVMSQVDKFPHSELETYVITRTARPSEDNVSYFNGDLRELILSLRKKMGKNIFCDGGAQLVNALLKEKLIDEMIISIVPVLVGNGIRLFDEGNPEQGMELLSNRHFDSGLVQLHYQMNKAKQ